MFIKKFKSVIALLLLPTLICSSLHLPVLAASTEDFIGIDSMSEPEYSIDISEFTEVIEEDWPELVIWGDSEDDFIGLNTNLVPEDSIDISEFTEVSEEDLLELIIWGNTGDGTIEEPEYSVDFSELEEVYESIVPTSTTMYVWDRFNIQYIQGTWTAYTAWSGTNQTATGRTGISFGASTGLVYSGNTITLSRTNTNGGNPVYTGTATSGTRIEINSSGQKRTRSITATQSRGTLVGTVSSASSTAYPTNGAQGGFWYANRRVVTLPMLTISRGTVTSATVHLTGTITNNGGATITEREFWIRRQSGNTTLRRVPVNTTSNTFSQTIPGLDPNTTYIARAVASNGVTTGHGQSAEIIFTTPPNITVPTAPLNFGATRGDRQVSLSWSAPSSNGGAAITSYQVSSNGGSSWVPLASSARSYTFTGLTNGTSYAFRVRAVNSAGDGAQASVSATPVGYPNLTVSRGTLTSTTVVLNGTITNNGGAAITNRGFFIRPTNGALAEHWIGGTANSFSHTITNLQPNTEYIARAVAKNSSGLEGAGQSEQIIFRTPAAPPTAPRDFRATLGDRQVRLNWSAPSSNGGATIQRYEVSRNNGSTWETASSNTGHTLTGLTAGTSYTFRVRAVNSAGDGTQAWVTVTAAGYPNLTVSRGTLSSTSVILYGTITNNGGYAIIDRGFWIRPSNGTLVERWIGGSASSFNMLIEGLQPNTEYIARAVAKNDSDLEGAGQSSEIRFTTPKGSQAAPAAPTVSSVTANSVTLVSVSGCEYSRNGTSWQTSTTFSGLSAGTTYNFYQRRAETATLNASPSSPARQATTSKGSQTAPAAPTVSSVTANSVTLISVSGCEYSRDGTSWQTSTTFFGLSAGTTYNFYQRRAETATLNASPSSPARQATTSKGSQTIPAAPTVSNVTQNSVTLVSVSGCEYSRNGTSWQASTTFSGLSAGTTYNFYQRRAETATLNASPSSPARQATTLSTTTYTITRTAPTNGSFSAPSTGTAGSTITISSITPNNGFSVGTITVRRHDTQATIPVSGTGTSRTFTMPASNVTVTIAFTSTGGGTPVNCPPLAYILRGTAAQYLSMGIGWPLGNEDDTERRSFNRISSAFGPRSSGLHLGFDMNRLNDNTPIDGIPLLAVTGGVVVDVNRDSSKGQGYSISIRSDTLRDPATSNLLIFTYMHMRDAPTLKIDDTVSKGQRIGRVGNTGTSTGPHLHFEVSNSGSVWGPGSDSWDRVTRRINPLFFYPAGSFVDNTNIWDEVRGVQPRSIDTELDFGEYEVGRFRPIFYNLPATFAELVGRDACRTWELSRTPEEIETENIAVGFVKYFSISKEDFTAANEQLRQNWVIREPSPQASSAEEIYPVDLIFTFDNESINRFFLWKNSSIPEERMLGQSDSSITSITIPDLSYNGTFSFNTIKLLTEGLTFDTVFVEINKYNALNTDPAKVSNTIGINAHGVGIYSPVPSSVHIDTKDGYIEIVVYEDDTRQKLFTRHIIRPALFEF